MAGEIWSILTNQDKQIMNLELRTFMLERLCERIIKESHLFVIDQKVVEEIRKAAVKHLQEKYPSKGITDLKKENN